MADRTTDLHFSTERMLRTVIVEDNTAERENVITFLAQLCPQVEVVGVASAVNEGVELIVNTRPDLLITDVQITGGSCYHLLDELRRNGHLEGLSIIFMTGFQNFQNATPAFKYAAVDFLVKPFSGLELQQAVQQVARQQEPLQNMAQLDMLLELLRTPASPHRGRIAVTLLKGSIQMLPLDDVLYLEAKSSMTTFYLKDQSTLIANRNLGHYAETLQTDPRFFSVSNSLFINLDYLDNYDHSELVIKLHHLPRVLYASRQGGQRLRQFLTKPQQSLAPQSSTLVGFFKKLLGKG